MKKKRKKKKEKEKKTPHGTKGELLHLPQIHQVREKPHCCTGSGQNNTTPSVTQKNLVLLYQNGKGGAGVCGLLC
jgi:hypothetical protein